MSSIDMIKILKWLVIVLLTILAIALLLRATSLDSKFNQASFEKNPLKAAILPMANGWTLSQRLDSSGKVRTILVVGFDDDTITGIDLQKIGAIDSINPFTVLSSLSDKQLQAAALDSQLYMTVDISQLISVAGEGERHLGIGTNFPEHAEEAGSDSVFNFPKFGRATPARTTVPWKQGGLLDYEVELCLRFDRTIGSLADFDAAIKGFFLCGDFTERATLLRLIDPQNLNSGTGFSDSKSGLGFFPSGALLVIPKDWQQFIIEERMTTSINGEPRQDARGAEMILNYRELTSKVLTDMILPRFLYQNDYVKLAPNGQIDQSMILMSGTSEGVIFTTPSRADIINGLFAYLVNGAIFSQEPIMSTLIESFIKAEYESEHFMQPADQIEFASSSMGRIVVKVEE
ncbi:MAG: 2-keto-4-pentenoate hydratase/2-oxohepta-3-ene-1,7-dioic acid hydratase in catechol pathway [Chitinophagales bacterium]|jgi:2-keto-4-pentenoate hydratase/2-oxohepta-3-ene-1,7-dioic acid hydratase in catechol pathway